MTAKPVVVVTRKLPDAVEARLGRDYDARLNPDDHQYSAEELIAGAAGAAAEPTFPRWLAAEAKLYR